MSDYRITEDGQVEWLQHKAAQGELPESAQLALDVIKLRAQVNAVRAAGCTLGQGYYSTMLFPFLMTVVLRNSVLHNWPAWLAVYGFMTMDRWLLGHWPTTGRFLEYMKITYGWSLLLVVVFCVFGST